MIPPGTQIGGRLVKKNRRNLLTGMAITLPTIWVKPVVNTVILPAHAAISEDTGCSTLGCIGEVPEGTPIPIDAEIRADFTVPEGGPIGVTFATTSYWGSIFLDPQKKLPDVWKGDSS